MNRHKGSSDGLKTNLKTIKTSKFSKLIKKLINFTIWPDFSLLFGIIGV